MVLFSVLCSDGTRCRDNYGCAHQCHSTAEGTRCACHHGYRLHPNGRDCIRTCPTKLFAIQGGSKNHPSGKMQLLDNYVRFLCLSFLIYMRPVLLQFGYFRYKISNGTVVNTWRCCPFGYLLRHLIVLTSVLFTTNLISLLQSLDVECHSFWRPWVNSRV